MLWRKIILVLKLWRFHAVVNLETMSWPMTTSNQWLSAFTLVNGCLFTCNSVESCDHQHEDSGEVEVPPETHLDEQGSRVQVSLMVETWHTCHQWWLSRQIDDGRRQKAKSSGKCTHTDILVKTDSSSERTARYVLILSPPKRRPRYSGIVTIWTHAHYSITHTGAASKHQHLRVHSGARCDLPN